MPASTVQLPSSPLLLSLSLSLVLFLPLFPSYWRRIRTAPVSPFRGHVSSSALVVVRVPHINSSFALACKEPHTDAHASLARSPPLAPPLLLDMP